ncbi:hypothetical protein, partial [Brevibacillus sp. SIMBA_040]|uniref:hypothetical protein n=1 Tax=Brevibacillus sp. SIMBA_040 TaxID=3085781 RepID=UPI00397DEB43
AHAFTLHFARLDRDPALGAIRLVERVYATKMRCLQYKCSGRADRRVQQGSEAIDVIGGFRSVKRLSYRRQSLARPTLFSAIASDGDMAFYCPAG